MGDWILIYFPQDETGKFFYRKLSRPWHGPYRIIFRIDPDVTAVKTYSLQILQYKYTNLESTNVHHLFQVTSTGMGERGQSLGDQLRNTETIRSHRC